MKTAFLVCVLLVSIFSTKSYAQIVKNDSTGFRPSIWGSVGLGTSSLGSFSGMASVNAEVIGHFILSANGTAESDAFIFSNTDVTTVNLLAGTLLKQKYFLLALSGGLGYVNAYQLNPNSGIGANRSGLNIPLMAQGYFVLAPGFGLGVGAYLNLNSIKTTAGLTASIAFGQLGTRKENGRHQHPKLF